VGGVGGWTRSARETAKRGVEGPLERKVPLRKGRWGPPPRKNFQKKKADRMTGSAAFERERGGGGKPVSEDQRRATQRAGFLATKTRREYRTKKQEKIKRGGFNRINEMDGGGGEKGEEQGGPGKFPEERADENRLREKKGKRLDIGGAPNEKSAKGDAAVKDTGRQSRALRGWTIQKKFTREGADGNVQKGLGWWSDAGWGCSEEKRHVGAKRKGGKKGRGKRR